LYLQTLSEQGWLVVGISDFFRFSLLHLRPLASVCFSPKKFNLSGGSIVKESRTPSVFAHLLGVSLRPAALAGFVMITLQLTAASSV